MSLNQMPENSISVSVNKTTKRGSQAKQSGEVSIVPSAGNSDKSRVLAFSSRRSQQALKLNQQLNKDQRPFSENPEPQQTSGSSGMNSPAINNPVLATTISEPKYFVLGSSSPAKHITTVYGMFKPETFLP